jgi:hypothetical protein
MAPSISVDAGMSGRSNIDGAIDTPADTDRPFNRWNCCRVPIAREDRG